METKNIKLKGGENKKAGKNTTQTILTTTGAAVIGAIGGAAVMNSSQEAELPIEPYEDELADQPTSNENVDAEKPQPEISLQPPCNIQKDRHTNLIVYATVLLLLIVF